MTYSTHFSKKITCVALVCVGAILLAWAAPMLLSGDLSAYLRGGQLGDTAEASTEIEDAADDPIVLVASSQYGLHPVTFVLQTTQLFDGAWSPTAPVRPPTLSTQSDPAAA